MKQLLIVVGVTLLAVACFFGAVVISAPPSTVTAAPPAMPTPDSASRQGKTPRDAIFFSARALAADTRSDCIESAGYDLMDIQYTVDQSTTNTITLKIQMSNDLVTYIDGLSAVSANAADASDMKQFQLFGRWTCINADVANANVITITARALFK
jgi:hypothetical protein